MRSHITRVGLAPWRAPPRRASRTAATPAATAHTAASQHDALVQLFGAQALHALLVASASLGHDAGRAAEKSAARVGSRGGDPARDRSRAMLREHGEAVAEVCSSSAASGFQRVFQIFVTACRLKEHDTPHAASLAPRSRRRATAATIARGGAHALAPRALAPRALAPRALSRSHSRSLTLPLVPPPLVPPPRHHPLARRRASRRRAARVPPLDARVGAPSRRQALLRLAHNFPAVPSALWPAAVTLHALVVECLPALARVARADGARALVKAMAACIDAPPAQEQLMRLLEECATRDFVARGALCDAGALNVVRKARRMGCDVCRPAPPPLDTRTRRRWRRGRARRNAARARESESPRGRARGKGRGFRRSLELGGWCPFVRPPGL